MELTIRAATQAEQLYAHEQSSQISNQCGSPGYLLGKFEADGMVFTDHWSQGTQEFRVELGQVLDTLRSNGQLLSSPAAMSAHCFDAPEYVFRADTQGYSYLIRCTSSIEGCHAAIYPYRRDWLDRHMKQAEKGIRFITPTYKELFRIPDGDMVRINRPDGTHIDRVCRYIDDCHLEVGNGWDSLFHICQFAEQMERCGNTVIPLRSSLPEQCRSVRSDGNTVTVKHRDRGEAR
jgi:hypothetical protein